MEARAVISQVARIRPRFHLHAGDLCYADMTGHGQPTDAFSSGAWDQWLTQIEPVASSSPWMCATGNHEMESGFGSQGYDGYLNRFWVPGGGAPGCPATYSFRYGNVGFVSLDSNDVSFEIPHNLGYLGGRQSSWLEQRLAAFHTPGSGVDFVVVFFHHCVYSTSGAHGSEGGVRENWVPLFDRYQVDLVVNGHAHVYERTSQLRHGQVTHHVERSEHVDASVGTTYITAGGGGFRSDGGFMQTGALVVQAHGVKQREQAPWSRPTRTTRHSFLAVHVTPRSIVDGDATMLVTAVDLDGLLFDDVTLVRKGQGHSSSHYDLPWLLAGGVAMAAGTGSALRYADRSKVKRSDNPQADRFNDTAP